MISNNEDRRPVELASEEPRQVSGEPAGRELQTTTRTPGGDREARGRETGTGHPDGRGPDDPAGDAPGA